MTDVLRCIGIDPGPVPGIVVLGYLGGHLEHADAIQCTHGIAPALLDGLLGVEECPTLVAAEAFVVRGRAGRSSSAGAGAITRELLAVLRRVATLAEGPSGADGRLIERPAAAVKPWATDERLAAAGLAEPTKGMRHARDAARHALFTAVRDGGIPDPLSKEAQR